MIGCERCGKIHKGKPQPCPYAEDIYCLYRCWFILEKM